MKWKFKKDDILFCTGSIFMKLIKIRDTLTEDYFPIDDELKYQYRARGINGKNFMITKKATELWYIRIDDEEFNEFFDLFLG